MPSRIPAHEFDVIVIGGGLAGIAAAQRLSEAGLAVALLEARSRLGGRVWTTHDAETVDPVELGAEWFDSYGTIHRLLAGRHVSMPEASGSHWRRTADGLQNIDEMADGGRELHRRLAQIGGQDRSLQRALRECCADRSYADARAMLLRYVEGFHAADPRYLSLRWLMTVEESQPAGVAELRTPTGLDDAIDAFLTELGRTCTVYLDAVVDHVAWRRGRTDVTVTSHGRRARFRARSTVVTLPLSILATSGAVRFVPALTSKHHAFAHLATGPVVKVIHRFDRPFWRDIEPLHDAEFVQDFSQPIPTWWTAPRPEIPLLVGWAAGPQATRLGRVSHDELRSLSLRSLARTLGRPVGDIRRHWLAWYHHDWQRDRFSRGAYSWVRVGGHEAYRALGRPLDDTLYFAGEATCGGGLNATMDGAIQSGWRAAVELLSRR